jgi:alkylhydroperoxidase/carboxymuconolactone decarboxylase family protein YurZ
MEEIERRRQEGHRIRAELGLDKYGDPWGGKSDAFSDHTLTELWGTLFTRPGLTLREREMITLAVIIAVGGSFKNMAPHMRGCMHLGLTEEQIQEIIVQAMYYAGWPKGAAATHIFAEVKELEAKRQAENPPA